MSAIVAAVADAPGDPARAVRTMLGAIPFAGTRTDIAALPGEPRVSLGAAGHDWERALRAGSGTIATVAGATVAADATLYHREDLRRALGLPGDAMPGDAALIAHAYARWGIEGFARLEGDFAIVLWDATRRRLVGARSFAGHRTLFAARTPDGIRVASTVGALLADGAVRRDLDLTAIATAAAGLWSHAPRTAYESIDELATGQVLTWDASSGLQWASFWLPPTEILHDREPIDAAAEELRALLVDAVRERAAPDGPISLSLSGGWDSTAVGGAATVALGAATRERLRPVSISYPAGDPGREDEMIADVVAQWGVGTRWIDVDGIALLPDAPGDARTRDLPFSHAYEQWNRALGAAARAEGARVLLDGVGGDQLFQVSDILLSDLFGRMRWLDLARQWRARGGTGARNLWRWAIRPALPPAIPALIARALRRPAPPHYLHRRAPFWVREEFLERSGALERDLAAAPRLPARSRVLAETHAYLRYPFFGRIVGHLRRFALEGGVELRSPLLDDRVVRFAARRPWHERSDGRETKILLRRAMRGLLPDHVLAPRRHRTGITSAYFLRQLRGAARPSIERTLHAPLLAELGIVDAELMRRAWDHILRHDDDDTAARLLFTVQAELWTRARVAPAMTA